MKDVVLSGRPLAMVVLAWSLVKVLFARAFNVKTGLALFRENYDEDRLQPVDPEERLAMGSFSRCIACARCDRGEGERIARSKGAYPGIMTIVLSSTRSMPDFDACARALAHVPDDVLREKVSLCPVGVPFLELATFVRRKGRTGAEPARTHRSRRLER